MGTFLVIFFFNGRSSALTNWLPNNRVLYRLQVSPSSISDKAMCQLECLKMDTSAVRVMKENGDVNFSKSNTEGPVMLYYIDHTFDASDVQMQFEVRDSSNTLVDVKAMNSAVSCDCP
jgi:hypothetical protein